MPQSYLETVSNGSTNIFPVPAYIQKSHISVFVDGVLRPTSDYTWTAPGLIQLVDSAASLNTKTILRLRTTPTAPLAQFVSGSLDPVDLNTVILQSLYVSEEAVESLRAVMRVDTDGAFDAEGRRIKDVAAPVGPNDVATKAYADTTVALAQAAADAAAGSALTAGGAAGAATTALGLADAARIAAQAAAAAAATFNPSDYVPKAGGTFTGAVSGPNATLDSHLLNRATANGLYAASSHSHGNATTGEAGFMSGADKTKLDGLSTAVPSRRFALFTTSTSWTVPARVTRVLVTVSGGGGGGGSDGGLGGAHGGGGGVARGEYAVTPGASITVTVGAGGAAGAGGSSSSFGALLSATGGAAGVFSTPGANGAGTGGNLVNSTSTHRFPTSVDPYTQTIGDGRPANSGTAAVAYNPLGTTGYGTPGFGPGQGSGQLAAGGVGGMVLVEWIA